jgi:RNA recognition motif-containing protein
MSLFIGNISRSVTSKDLHNIFDKYGKCTVDVKGSFAFVDYEQMRAAEQAKNAMHGKEIAGNIINIEWSHKGRQGSKKPVPASSSSQPSRPARGDIECYACTEIGHMAKECKYQEKNENGHHFERDRDSILDTLRKEKSRNRLRLKSPNRYTRAMAVNYNFIKVLPG